MDESTVKAYLEGGGLQGWLGALTQPKNEAEEEFYRWQTLQAKDRLQQIGDIYPWVLENPNVRTLFDIATGYGAPLVYKEQAEASKELRKEAPGRDRYLYEQGVRNFLEGKVDEDELDERMLYLTGKYNMLGVPPVK